MDSKTELLKLQQEFQACYTALYDIGQAPKEISISKVRKTNGIEEINVYQVKLYSNDLPVTL